jgi:hypothetical protein
MIMWSAEQAGQWAELMLMLMDPDLTSLSLPVW